MPEIVNTLPGETIYRYDTVRTFYGSRVMELVRRAGRPCDGCVFRQHGKHCPAFAVGPWQAECKHCAYWGRVAIYRPAPNFTAKDGE